MEAAAKVGMTYGGKEIVLDSELDENGDGEILSNLHLVFCSYGQQQKTRVYHIDAVLDFDPVRKRMSVMVRHANGRCFVYTKGAEVAMLDPRVRHVLFDLHLF